MIVFTQDEDSYVFELCHPAYCLVWLDVCSDEAAFYVRRFLRHPSFSTVAQRLGGVARAHPGGIHFWRRNNRRSQFAPWD